MSVVDVIPYENHVTLFEGLAECLEKTTRGVVPVRMVVPSVHFRDWLQIEIARRFGICMGFEFSMPGDFVEEVFRVAGIERASEWSKRRLAWTILELTSATPELLPALPAGASIRDRFAMARTVADSYDQYAHFRPEMLEAWAGGGEFLKKNSLDESWQRSLWRSLRDSLGRDPGLIPSRLSDPVAAQKLKAAFLDITVIGSGSLDPLLVEILAHLAHAGSRVDVRIALPCLGYLADLRRQTHEKKLTPSAEGDPEGFDLGVDAPSNPLLVSMGRHAAGTFVLLGQLDDQYTHWPATTDPEPLRPYSSLLGRLQNAVRSNTAFEKKSPLLANDRSLSIHECHGPRRELEVLRDELLRAFRDVPGLKPCEVLIAATSLEIDAPLVSAVFQTKENPLPVRLAELPPGEGDEVLEGLLTILEIARGGRGRASEILDLLQLRAVHVALAVEDDDKALEVLADKLRASGLAQGFSGLENSQPGGWQFSIRRLASGVFFGPHEPLSAGEETFDLPVADLFGSSPSETNRFLDWLSELHSTLREWQKPASARDWSRRLAHAAEKLLAGRDGRLAEISKLLDSLSEIPGQAQLDAAGILDWLAPEVEESNRRVVLSGATLFARLRQIHNTPCRVLALVGMQNDGFPSRSAAPSWDLLRAKPKIWDRHPRVDDRQMFLDSILAPTDRLIITASTRNIRTNKNQPLSTCVGELLSAATQLGADRKALVSEHPLQPFSLDYFDSSKNLGSPFGANLRDIAIAAINPEKTKRPFISSSAPEDLPAPMEISIADLAAFWKNPARAFLKALKIDLPMEEEDDNTLDFPPIGLDGLQSWKLRFAIVENLLSAHSNGSRTKALLQADRALPPGYLADSEWNDVFDKMELIARAVQQNTKMLSTIKVDVSGWTLIHPVRLSGETIIAWDPGKLSKPKHWLPHWIAALTGAASGLGGGIQIFSEGNPLDQKNLPAIDPAGARETLAAFLQGYLEGQTRPLRFAPETSEILLGNAKESPGNFVKARAKWAKEKSSFDPVEGEGMSPAARLIWRDTDPFLEPDEWMHWANAVSRPMKEWRSKKK
jgi:exodeoxyribonuclease V gamma subunit